ncbi:hypothetical protein [Cognatishimia sp. F0-27]|uniref:hypothetical protein n=1 Tax=Cognatishimia sp. F0-27 TaxID=2816855 RepID=UPI002104706E|nr:hypothetical protein [Cognatishimia sp. F0-27]
MLRADAVSDRPRGAVKSSATQRNSRTVPDEHWERKRVDPRRKKKKKRKSLAKRFLSEAFDALEDIFD